MEQKLEQILKTSATIDKYVAGTSALFTPPLAVYNSPSGGFAVHIHGTPDGNTLYGGSFKEFGTDRTLRTFNGYEASMYDHLYGKELGLPNKMNRW